MANREGHGWWPYLLPLFLFLGLGEVALRFPASSQPFFLPLKVILPAGLFLLFWRRGAYPELRGYTALLPGLPLDIAVGVLGAAVWMAPYIAVSAWRPGADAAFDPQQLGPDLAWLALGLRCVGYGVVTPFVEELFVRSWLGRYAEVFDRNVDFRDIPIAHYTRRSFWVVVVFFTASHVPWEWPVAVLWVVGTQLWFYHRKHLMALVVVHASSNLSIFFFVLLCSGRIHGWDGQPVDLWFFL